MRNVSGLALLLVFAALLPAQSPLPAPSLTAHDFLYAGESHERRIFIVRHGQVVWSYDDPAGKGEISDCVMLSNGNILFAHQFGLTLISPEKKVLWNYEPPPAHEVHTAVPIGTNSPGARRGRSTGGRPLWTNQVVRRLRTVATGILAKRIAVRVVDVLVMEMSNPRVDGETVETWGTRLLSSQDVLASRQASEVRRRRGSMRGRDRTL